MKYALGNMLNGGVMSADGLALDLQFAADKSLVARKGPTPTFTRASSGTFVGSNGLIQSAATNVARFDHDPVTLASRGLLIEESRTNLLQRSEGFGNAYWATTRASITQDATASPDGLTTADKLIADTTAASNHRVDRATIALALNTVHTLSIYAKASEYTGLAIGVGLGATEGVRFSLVGAGTATPVAAGNTGTIQQLSNGWYRCTCTFTSDAVTATHRVAIFVGQNGTTTTYTGDGTSGIFIWGAQLEAGSFATSYIPTVASSVVRSADVCSITGAAFSGIWNAVEGTAFASAIKNSNTGNPRTLSITNGTSGNRIEFQRGASQEQVAYYAGGSFLHELNLGSVAAGVNYRVAHAAAANNFAASRDGLAAVTNNSGVMVTADRMIIGASFLGSTGLMNGTINAIRYYRKRLDNSKIQALTA